MRRVRRAVVADGVELAYVEVGSGEPVVLVHGSLADLSYWEWSGQAGRLGEKHRVIAYSRRYNHPNRNVPEGEHSPMVEAADLRGLLDVLDVGAVHLVGHSYGAYAALVFALDHPARLRTLVLAEPPLISWLPALTGGEGIYESFMAGVWAPLNEAFHEGGDQAGLEFTAHWYFGVGFAEVAPEWQELWRNNVAEWRALAASPRTYPRLDPDRVAALTVPTLLLSAGRNVGGFNDLVDGELARLIPGAGRVTIPGVGHEMFLDSPRVTAEVIARHVADHQDQERGRGEPKP